MKNLLLILAGLLCLSSAAFAEPFTYSFVGKRVYENEADCKAIAVQFVEKGMDHMDKRLASFNAKLAKRNLVADIDMKQSTFQCEHGTFKVSRLEQVLKYVTVAAVFYFVDVPLAAGSGGIYAAIWEALFKDLGISGFLAKHFKLGQKYMVERTGFRPKVNFVVTMQTR